MCFELERLLLDALGDAITVVDEVSGFRYFDSRDLLGFVDGTANPLAAELADATLIAPDADPDFAGGSYVVVQKYLHDVPRWNALSSEEQQAIIGRTKVDNVELDDDPTRPAHKTLATIEDEDGTERDILRDNMPFGRPGAGRVRHVLHRLHGTAVGARADARAHVRRRPARDLRPPAGLLHRDHRDHVLRADQRHARPSRPTAGGRRGVSSGGSLGIGSLKTP